MLRRSQAELEAFCDAWFRAWSGGDVERLVATFADGCQYSDPSRPEGIHGKDELRRYLAKWLPRNPDMVWTRRDLFPVEGGFAVTWTAQIPVGDATLIERGMDLVLLDDEMRVTRNEVYFDMTRWRDALLRDGSSRSR